MKQCSVGEYPQEKNPLPHVKEAFLAGIEHERKKWTNTMISAENGYPDDESGDYRAGYDICWITIQRLITGGK